MTANVKACYCRCKRHQNTKARTNCWKKLHMFFTNIGGVGGVGFSDGSTGSLKMHKDQETATPGEGDQTFNIVCVCCCCFCLCLFCADEAVLDTGPRSITATMQHSSCPDLLAPLPRPQCPPSAEPMPCSEMRLQGTGAQWARTCVTVGS